MRDQLKFKAGDLITSANLPTQKRARVIGRVVDDSGPCYRLFWLDPATDLRDQLKLFPANVIDHFYEKEKTDEKP